MENFQAYKKLSAFQRELNVPKTHINKHANFHYRNAEDILEAVKKLTEKHDVCIYCESQTELVGNYIYQTVRAHFVCAEGEIIASASARENDNARMGMDGSQISGSALTYCKRYALSNLLSLDDSEVDPDATNEELKNDKVKSSSEKKATKAQPASKAAAPAPAKAEESGKSRPWKVKVLNYLSEGSKFSKYQTYYNARTIDELTDEQMMDIYAKDMAVEEYMDGNEACVEYYTKTKPAAEGYPEISREEMSIDYIRFIYKELVKSKRISA